MTTQLTKKKCPKTLGLFTRHSWLEKDLNIYEWVPVNGGKTEAEEFANWMCGPNYTKIRICKVCFETQAYYQSDIAAGWHKVEIPIAFIEKHFGKISFGEK